MIPASSFVLSLPARRSPHGAVICRPVGRPAGDDGRRLRVCCDETQGTPAPAKLNVQFPRAPSVRKLCRMGGRLLHQPPAARFSITHPRTSTFRPIHCVRPAGRLHVLLLRNRCPRRRRTSFPVPLICLGLEKQSGDFCRISFCQFVNATAMVMSQHYQDDVFRWT